MQLGVQVIGSNIGLRATLDQSVAAANAWADATEAAGQRAGLGISSGLAEADKASATLRGSLLETADAANVFASKAMAASVRAARSLELTGVAAQQAEVAYARLGMAASRYGAGTVGEAAAVARYTSTVQMLYDKQIAAANAAAAAQDRAAIKFQGSVRTVGRALTTYVSLPLAAVGYESIKLATTFQAAMMRIQTYAGASATEVNNMKEALLSNAGFMPQGPIQAAEALYHLESIGLRGARALDALKVASIAAGAGEASLTDATTALGGVLVSNIQGAQNTSSAMAYLVAIAGQGNMTLQDLNNALGTGLAAKASALGVSLREIGAAMTVMVDRGVPARRSATYLGATMALMSAPSKSAQDAITQMGISWQWMSHELDKPGGFIAVINKLHERMQAMGREAFTPLLLSAFGRSRQSTGIQVLVTSLLGHTSTINQKYAQIEQAHKDSLDRMALYQQTAQYKLHTALSEVEADFIRLGSGVAPGVATDLKEVANVITDIANAFSGLPEPAKRALGILAVGATITGPMLLLLDTVLKVSRAVRGMMAGPGAAGMGELSAMATVASSRVEVLQGQIAALQVELDGLVAADTGAAGGFVEIGTAADSATTQIGALQERIAGLQVQLAAASTEAETFGVAMQAGGAGGLLGGGMGALGRAGMYGIGGLVAGQMAQSLIPGQAGQGVGRTLEFAGAGAAAGSVIPGVGTALGAGLGAVVGATYSLTSAFSGATESVTQLSQAAQSAQHNVLQTQTTRAQLRVNRDQAQSAVWAASAALATNPPGSAGHRSAVDQLSAAELNLKSVNEQLRAATHALTKAQETHTTAVQKAKQAAKEATEQMVGQMLVVATMARNYAKNHPSMSPSDADRIGLQNYIRQMRDLATSMQSSNPKLAAVATQLGSIATATRNIPSNKTVTVTILERVKRVQAPVGPQGPALPSPGDGGGGQGKNKKRPVVPLTGEQAIQVALATNPGDKQAIMAQIGFDQRSIAELKRQRARGQITNAEFVTAVTGFYQDLNSMRSSLTSTKKKTAAKTPPSFALPLALQASMARADALAALDPSQQGPSALQIRLAKQAKAAAMKAINSHTLTLQNLIAAWGIVGQENAVLAQAHTAGTANLYHKVSSDAITDAVKGLNATQELQLRERISQADAHRSYAPKDRGAHSSGVSASGGGTTIMINGAMSFHGIQNVQQLEAELNKLKSVKHSRAGGRR
jgi:TP901 family phage tail tape measure protein